MMKTAKIPLIRLLLVLTAVSLSACGTLNSPKPGDAPEYRPVAPVSPIPASANNGAIFQASQSGLFEDDKAHRVGDLLTVVLSESTNAKKSSATSTSKKTSTGFDVGVPTIAGVNELNGLGSSLFGLSNSSDNSFDGSGDSSQSNQLSGQITVTVSEVLPNGNMVIQGEKWLGINQGSEFVRLRGIVRAVDITTSNTVQSTQIANAQIYYGGTGVLNENNAQGWLSRFFNHPIWPI